MPDQVQVVAEPEPEEQDDQEHVEVLAEPKQTSSPTTAPAITPLPVQIIEPEVSVYYSSYLLHFYVTIFDCSFF